MYPSIQQHHQLDSISFGGDTDFGEYAIVRNVFAISEKNVQCTTTYAILADGELCSSFRLNIALVQCLLLEHGVPYAEAEDAARNIVEMNAHYVASYTLPHIYGD